jgi:hypothetical protein
VSSPTALYAHVTSTYTARLVRYAPYAQMGRHAHDEDGISIVLDGELVEEAEHRSVQARGGWLVNKPAGVYHANRFGPQGALLLAVIPGASLTSMIPRALELGLSCRAVRGRAPRSESQAVWATGRRSHRRVRGGARPTTARERAGLDRGRPWRVARCAAAKGVGPRGCSGCAPGVPRARVPHRVRRVATHVPSDATGSARHTAHRDDQVTPITHSAGV